MSERWSLRCENADTRLSNKSSFPCSIRGSKSDCSVPDTIIDDVVIADPKVTESFTDSHFRQMLGYLAITRLELALLLNFKRATLEWKRVVREQRDYPRASA